MLTLSRTQIEKLTGYRRRAEQLAELHRRGFSRAFVNAAGELILTQAHYDAVERGQQSPPRPKVRHRETTT